MDLWRRSKEGDSQQNKRIRSLEGSDVFNEIFCILVKMCPLYKLRHVSSKISFIKLTGSANTS